MSSTEWFCSISTPNGVTLYIANGRITGGSLALDRKQVIEPLETPGRDGRRYRKINSQKEPIGISGWVPCVTYEPAERQVIQLVGQVCTVFLRVGTETLQYASATVLAASITARTQKLYGYGQETGADRTIGVDIVFDAANTVQAEPTL